MLLVSMRRPKIGYARWAVDSKRTWIGSGNKVMELSIVVPCYNESKNLERLLDAFREELANRSYAELLLVDNGSTDDSATVLRVLLAKPENRFARSVRVPKNQGYGYGIVYGLNHADAEYLAWTHADLQTPPADVFVAYNRIRGLEHPHQSVVLGRRMGRPVFDQLFTTAMGWFASAALRCPLSDINAQPKLFHRSMLQHLENAPHDFTLDLFLLYTAHQLNYCVSTIPVRFEKRTAGEAKGGGSLKGKYKLSKRTITQILNLRAALKQGDATQKLEQQTVGNRRAA
jgi:glycosyltransferase involved in cell wall biosynthesis